MVKRDKLVQNLAIMMTVLMVIVGNLTNSINLEAMTTLNRHTVALLLLKSGKILGINLLLIVVAYYLIRNPLKSQLWRKLWQASWLYSVTLSLLGFSLALIVYSKQVLLQSVFPNLLNSNSVVTAIIIVSLLSPYLNNGLDNIKNQALLILDSVFLALFAVAPMLVRLIPSLSSVMLPFNDFMWALLIYLLVFSCLRLKNITNKKLLCNVKIGSSLLIGILMGIVILDRWLGFYSGLALAKIVLTGSNNVFLLFIMMAFWQLSKRWWQVNQEQLLTLFGICLIADHFLLMPAISAYVLKITSFDNAFTVLWKAVLFTVVIYAVVRLINKTIKGNQGWGSRTWTYYGGFIAALILYLGMTVSNFNYHYLTIVYTNHDKLLLNLLNLLLLFLLYLSIVAIFNRLILSVGIFSLVGIIYIVANQLKINARNEPILPIEFSNIFNIPDLLKIIQPIQVFLMVIIVVVGIGAIGFVQYRLKGKAIFKWYERSLFLVMTAVLFSVCAYFIPDYTPKFSDYQDTAFNRFLKDIQYKPVQTTPSVQMQYNGQIVGLVSMARVKVMDKPKGYSQAKVNAIVKKYETEATTINQDRTGKVGDQTVIYVLSESLANPNRIPGVKLSQNPLSYLDQIKQKNTSGLMDSYGYGGGTANIEFEALTSLSMNNFAPSMSIPYLYLVSKLKNIPTVMDDFSTKNAIHPFTPTIYSRNRVFKKFGFQHFYNLDSDDKLTYTKKIQNSDYISDDSAFKETLKQVGRTKKGQFIQLTTMQNHMPYLANDYQNTIKVSGDLTKSSQAELETYTQGISFTDKALKQFINKVNKIDKKVTVVFYGDHLPSVYNFKTDNDSKQSKYDQLLHQTDFFIYSNFKSPVVSQNKVVSPYMFTPMMLAQTNSKVSPYYALLTDVWQKTPASERQKTMDSDGNYITTKVLNKETKQIMKDYKLIQYDITNGNQYTYQTDFYKTK